MARFLLAFIVCLWSVTASAQITGSGGILYGANVPSSCSKGDVFASYSIGTISICTATNTWTTTLVASGDGANLTGLTKTQVGLANVDNTSDAAKPVSTATQTALNGKQASGTYATGTGTASGTNTGDQTITLTGGVTGSGTGSFAATVVTNANLTGAVTSAGNATSYATAVPFSLGGIGACAATSATTGTMTVSMVNPCITITPSGACTFNATGGVAGQTATFMITTSGSSSFVLTWGTNYHTAGTLATGVTTARFFSVTFRYDGSKWWEIARTAVQT